MLAIYLQEKVCHWLYFLRQCIIHFKLFQALLLNQRILRVLHHHIQRNGDFVAGGRIKFARDCAGGNPSSANRASATTGCTWAIRAAVGAKQTLATRIPRVAIDVCHMLQKFFF